MGVTITDSIIWGIIAVYFLLYLPAMQLNNPPVVDIARRWLRWVLFALIIGNIFFSPEQLFNSEAVAFWRVAAIAFLLWFLGETVYNWMLISALSRSEVPLFPRYRASAQTEDWLEQPRFSLLRNWLKARGFHRIQGLRAHLDQSVSLESAVYQSEDGVVRLQILFMPRRTGEVEAQYVLSTQTEEDELVITDNINLPYGGYYPQSWFLVRKPLLRSLEKLLNLHKRRLLHGAVNVAPWPPQPEDIANEINERQGELEKLNREAGFLLPTEYAEDFGRLSIEGRYRLWKEMWLLKYLGTTLR